MQIGSEIEDQVNHRARNVAAFDAIGLGPGDTVWVVIVPKVQELKYRGVTKPYGKTRQVLTGFWHRNFSLHFRFYQKAEVGILRQKRAKTSDILPRVYDTAKRLIEHNRFREVRTHRFWRIDSGKGVRAVYRTLWALIQ